MPLLSNETWRGWLGEATTRACASFHGINERSPSFEFALWAYVFMPEHVHLLVKPRGSVYDVSAFRRSLKQGVSKRIVNALREKNAPVLAKLRVQERPGKECYRFWQEGPGHDKIIWSLAKAIEKAVYGHRNPVERKLVRSPEQWRWSSFRWLELGKNDQEPLAVDVWDERLRDDPDGEALAAYTRSQWHQFLKGTRKDEA